MKSYLIFATILTVAYVIYYAVNIARDLYRKKGQGGKDEEIFELVRMKAKVEAEMEDSVPYLSDAFTADDMYKAMVSGGRLENRPEMAWKPVDKH